MISISLRDKIYLSLVIMFSCLFANIVSAQYQIGVVPRKSPETTTSYKIGYTDIEIRYGSPAVRGRKIWGALVPFDVVWRAGANEATKITISSGLEIAGNHLEAGAYAMFIIPDSLGEWTIIFNKVADQWGAFTYDEKEDALWVKVTPNYNKNFQERLQYLIVETEEYKGVNITLKWENVELTLPARVQYVEDLKEMITTRVDTVGEDLKWVLYLQGSEFLVQMGDEPKLAGEWLGLSEKLFIEKAGKWQKAQDYFLGHIRWTKAKVSALKNDYKQAINIVEKLKLVEGKYSFYGREKEDEKIDEYLQKWKDIIKK